MMNLTVKQFLQDQLGSYLKDDEVFEGFLNGDAVDISSLELSAFSDKRKVTRLLNKGWLKFDIDSSGIINTMQLRMKIFRILNVFHYSVQAELLKKLTVLTQSYLKDDIHTAYQDIAETIQSRLEGMHCEAIRSYVIPCPTYLIFTAKSNFFDHVEDSMKIMLATSEILNGSLLLTTQSEGLYQYKLRIRSASRMEQPQYVEMLKENLLNVLLHIDNVYGNGSDADLIDEYFKDRKVRQNDNYTISSENTKDASHKVINRSKEWLESKKHNTLSESDSNMIDKM